MHSGSSPRGDSGILKALMRSTLFKDILRTNLKEMSPHSGSSSLKTLMGEDPEVFFGIVSTLPGLINLLIRTWTELAVQLKDKYPPEMLKSYLLSLYEDIDKDAVAACCKAWAELASSLWEASPELRKTVTAFVLESGPGVKAASINALARFINKTTLGDPQVFSTFISKVFKAIDGPEVGKAAHTLAGALLDQKWHLASWAWKLGSSRLKRRFGL